MIRVLLIDDDPDTLKMIGMALRRAGMEVLTALHGDIGLRLFEEERPDVAIVDIAMPGMDGYDVIQHMRRAEGPDRHTPILVLTAHAEHLMKTYADELGADVYLTKPITMSDLVAHIWEATGAEMS